MKLICLPLLALLMLLPASTDAVNTVAQLLGKGSVSELAKLLAPEVEIELPGVEQEMQTKASAIKMLEKFFTQNKPIGSKVLHKIDAAAGNQYAVVTLSTTRGLFRASFNLKDEKGAIQMVKLVIEPAKVQ
jgi:hypothetical protein